MKGIVPVLSALAARIDRRDKDVSPAAMVIATLAHRTAAADVAALRAQLSAMASVREALEPALGEFSHKPVEALREPSSYTFLSGALWAMSEATQARIDHLCELAARQATGSERSRLRELIVAELGRVEQATPSELTAAAREQGLVARSDAVSKAISDLLKEDRIVAGPGEPAADRRRRFFRLSPAPSR